MSINDGNSTYGNDQVQSADIINSAGVQGALTVGTTAVEAKVGPTRLDDRKLLTVHNNSLLTIYWGYTSGVTTATGTPIFANQMVEWDIGEDQPVYLITTLAGQNVRITECA